MGRLPYSGFVIPEGREHKAEMGWLTGILTCGLAPAGRGRSRMFPRRFEKIAATHFTAFCQNQFPIDSRPSPKFRLCTYGICRAYGRGTSPGFARNRLLPGLPRQTGGFPKGAMYITVATQLIRFPAVKVCPCLRAWPVTSSGRCGFA